MAGPQSIKSASAVAPAGPDEAAEAVKAEAGSNAQFSAGEKSNSGAGSSTKGDKGSKNTGRADPTKTGWIEVVLVGEDGKGIPGEPVEVTTAEGTFTGTTDDKGLYRRDGIEPGQQCDITFPRLDKDAWEPA